MKQAMTLTDQVQDFTMCLREQIMDYYKGSCVTRFNSPYSHGIQIQSIELQVSGRRSYQYERRLHNNRAPRRLYFQGSPLMELWKNPDEVTLFMHVLTRSPELSEVHQQLTTFFTKYMKGVKLNENNTRYKEYTDPGYDSDIGPTPRDLDLPQDTDDEFEPDPVSEALIAMHRARRQSAAVEGTYYQEMDWSEPTRISQPVSVRSRRVTLRQYREMISQLNTETTAENVTLTDDATLVARSRNRITYRRRYNVDTEGL